MKKTLSLLAILSLLLTQKTSAQLEKGNVLVGADLAHFDLGLSKNTGYDVSISPKAGWFVEDNLALGAYATLGFSRVNKESATRTNYGIGVLSRKYVDKPEMNLTKHGRWFGEANLGIEGSNVSNGGGSTNGLGFGFGPGYAYFITQNIGLETALTYNGLLGFGDKTYQHTLNLNFGFQIYLPGKATMNKVVNDVK